MPKHGGSVEGCWEDNAEILGTNCYTANLSTRNPRRGLNWDWNQKSAVNSRWLTASDMA